MKKAKRGRPSNSSHLSAKIAILETACADLRAHAGEQTTRITDLCRRLAIAKQEIDQAIAERNDAQAFLWRRENGRV